MMGRDLRRRLGLVSGLTLLLGLGLAASPRAAEASCVPGFDFAMFTNGSMSLENGANTDSYNSALAAYDPLNPGCAGNLGSNVGTVSVGSVVLQNSSKVCGTITTGGGSVSTSSGSSFRTPALTVAAAMTLTPVTFPIGLSSASLPFSGTLTDGLVHVLNPNFNYSALNVSCTNGSTIQLSDGQYYFPSGINLSNCNIKVVSGPTGTVIVFTKGKFNISGGTINGPPNTGLPTDLLFLGTTDDGHIMGSAKIYAGIYLPTSVEMHIETNAEIWGSVVAASYHGENGAKIHYDAAMAAMAVPGYSCSVNEVSRASPVIAALSGTNYVVQGSFETPSGTAKVITTTASIATWAYPYLKGHMRARTAASISTTGSTFASGTILFDAGASGNIPARTYGGCGTTTYTGTCRHIFTNTNTTPTDGRTFHPTMVELKDSTADAIGALIAPTSVVAGITSANWQTIVRAVLDGPLGGVDRSTIAVIPPSAFAGSPTRPTVAYFGGTDGMLHAVCASNGGTTASVTSPSTVCPSSGLGKELWAYLPGSQLSAVRSNLARVDGSPQVIDAFGDFTHDPATGAKSWHTILTFQTGYAYGGKSGSYALDVTDPAMPVVLWEYRTPNSPGSVDFGTGLLVAQGATHINAQRTNLAVAETNNGGTGGAGTVVTAMYLETGATLWQFSYLFPATPREGVGMLPYPTTGIPGSVVAVDLGNAGEVTDYVFGDLYGDVWRINAATGVSFSGASTPLFRFTTDKHPIGTPAAIFSSGGSQFAAFASGGYDDPISTSWSVANQYIIAVKLSPATGSTYPSDQTTTTCTTCNVMLVQGLTGSKSFAQVLVVGNQLFVTSDTNDVSLATYGAPASTSGVLTTVNLATLGITTVTIRSGAGSLANVGTTLYQSSSDTQQQMLTNALSATGTSVDISTVPKIIRGLWLRTE
jgi:hypothetical protein